MLVAAPRALFTIYTADEPTLAALEPTARYAALYIVAALAGSAVTGMVSAARVFAGQAAANVTAMGCVYLPAVAYISSHGLTSLNALLLARVAYEAWRLCAQLFIVLWWLPRRMKRAPTAEVQ